MRSLLGGVTVLPEERRNRILHLIEQNGSATINEISALMNVSPMTVRRDIAHLAAHGAVVKTHGGAISPRLDEPLYSVKRKLNVTVKQMIGAEAAKLVQDGEAVILDSGSTTFYVAVNLKAKRGLTVVTNDLVIAHEMSKEPSNSVLFIGGMVRPRIFSTVGSYAEEMLKQLSVDKTFLGADAIHLNKGLLNSNLEEVPIKRLMINAAQEVILVADHTKFSKLGLGFVCDLSAISTVVTDKQVPPEAVAELKSRGISVYLC